MQELNDIKNKIFSMTGGGEILFIVPPFGSIDDVALGPHILQALAQKNGYKADILYLNILLASIIGVEHYNDIYFSPEFWMLGERIFARSAHGLPPLGYNPEYCINEAMSIKGREKHVKMFYGAPSNFDQILFLQTEQICKLFIDEAASCIASMDYRIIGCTASMTRQTNCCIALLNAIKNYSPEKITIIGGSNCRGELAEGIASLSPSTDYIFSGEGEISFINFLNDYSAQKLPSQRIIPGFPLNNLDALPLADYQVYYHQYSNFLCHDFFKKTRIWYETSRGCWWAQNSKCRFCSEHEIPYRQKSALKAVQDIKKIKEDYPDKMIFMSDIIMPHSYHKELLPLIIKEDVLPEIAYQLRANQNLETLIELKEAKINAVLPGIETFSTNLLKLMNKKNTGRHSLLFLRNAKCVDIYCDWVLLWGFPRDILSDYEEILYLLPLIRHLQPPRNFEPMILTRSSPYFEEPQQYQIENVHPWHVFNTIYPPHINIDKLALYYWGGYPSESYENPETIEKISDEIKIWKEKWTNSFLVMKNIMNSYIIYDRRDINDRDKTHVLDYHQAKKIMTSHFYQNSKTIEWALAEKLGVIIDSWYVPLVTAKPNLLLKFE